MAQALAQGIVNVFNPKYKPRGSEEKDLFTLQLYYIYAIFCSNLKTDFRQKLVRDYESSQNAQAIWKELSNDAEKSMVAQLNSTDLLQYTHTAQVENWKGTTLSFILHYQEQIWLYDQLQPPNKQTSDHAKMIYLQNAVYAIKELRLVQTTGSQVALANGTVPTYKDYEALIKSAASTYYRAHAPAKRQPTRSAERTDIWDANVTKSFHKAYEFGFDIDTPTDIVQAHMRNQSGVIPKETFGRFSPESRNAWSQLSDDVRADILWALQVNGSQRSQESTRMPL
jgi:K+-sensing histidine kinase KdpD